MQLFILWSLFLNRIDSNEVWHRQNSIIAISFLYSGWFGRQKNHPFASQNTSLIYTSFLSSLYKTTSADKKFGCWSPNFHLVCYVYVRSLQDRERRPHTNTRSCRVCSSFKFSLFSPGGFTNFETSLKRLHKKELPSRPVGLSFRGLDALSLSLLESLGTRADKNWRERKL